MKTKSNRLLLQRPTLRLRQQLITVIVVSGCLSIGFANASSAKDRSARQSTWGEAFQPPVQSEIRAVPKPPGWVQSDQNELRSKSDVVQEVKNRYNARVLKISLNEQRGVYNVRILMPSGKVRKIQVSARR